MKLHVPKEIYGIRERLAKKEARAYIVGGWVRDLLLNKPSKDIDIFCSLNPDELQKLFPDAVVMGTAERHERVYTIRYKDIDISTFRKNGERTELGKDLKQHSATCDFTINSMAIDIYTAELVDYQNGMKDLNKGVLRFVGDANTRIEEDPIRLMRAVRFAITKDFIIPNQSGLHGHNAYKIMRKSPSLIKDELNKILLSDKPGMGIEIMRRLNLLRYIFPELVVCEKFYCGKNHTYSVYRHIISSLGAEKSGDLITRKAILYHDQEKPKEFDGERFLGHEDSSAELAKRKMTWLGYSKKQIEQVYTLVKHHMFMGKWYAKNGERKMLTDKAIRRLIKRVSPELIFKLLMMRQCDKMGKDKKHKPPFEEITYVAEKVTQFLNAKQPFSRNDLKINGNHLIKLKIEPKQRGVILNKLLDKVIDDPKLNTKKTLLKLVEELK